MMKAFRSAGALALMEMVMVILFFSLTAAVYVRTFTSAHMLEKSSKNLTEATLIAQDMAEVFYGCTGDASKAAEVLPDGTLLKDGIVCQYYDSDWERLPAGTDAHASFTAKMTCHPPDGEGLARADILVAGSDGSEIYSLSFVRYTGR